MKIIKLKIGGMHCTSCAMNIDFELEDLAGVNKSDTNYAKQETVVSFDPQVATPQNIIQAIKKLEYDALPIDEQ